MNILIVEDALDQRLVLSKFLRKKNFNVFEANDGKQAFQLLVDNSDIQMVISDWIMPNMNGVELIEKIRNYSFNRYIYFIILTEKNTRSDLMIGMNHGADDYLNKPLQFDELEVRLNAGIRIVQLELTLTDRNKQLSRALSVIDEDLKAAAKTQKGLLPNPTTIKNVSFDWFFQPSKVLGGDMFDYMQLDDQYVSFYQLDVAGHGIPSALFSFSLNRILSELSNQGSIMKESISEAPYYRIRTPKEVLKELNRRFQTTVECMHYFTITYGTIDLKTGKVELSQAGHPPVFWLQYDQQLVHSVQTKGVPIGMLNDMDYTSVDLIIKPKDRLFIYSDGVTDCVNNQEEFFGKQRLIESLDQSFTQTLNQTVCDLKSTLNDWKDGHDLEDDISFLLLEWNK